MASQAKQALYGLLGGCVIVAIVVVIVAVVGFIAMLRLDDSETLVTRAADYDEWTEKGGGTWLPFSMPKSLRDFCEVHDLDTGEVYTRFYIDPADIPQLTGKFTEVVLSGQSTWPPKERVFIREEFPCPACSVQQDRIVVNVETGFVEYTSDSSTAISGIPSGGACK